MPVYGKPGTNQERTFLAVKPDGVQRGLVGDIIARFEKRGYKLVGLKMVWPTPEMAAEHYADLSKKPFFPGLVKFFSSGPIVCMCWEGKDIIKQGRQMLGETQPLASKPGSIRGDYSIDLGRNICHGSDSPESAAHELKMWYVVRDEKIAVLQSFVFCYFGPLTHSVSFVLLIPGSLKESMIGERRSIRGSTNK